MRYELVVALRYLKAKSKERFISFISWISILGVAVGVMTLIVVLGVMAGFDNELKDKIIGANPHIIVEKEGGIENYQEMIKDIRNIFGVVDAAPFIEGQGILRYEDKTMGVVIRGIDPAREQRITEVSRYLTRGGFNLRNEEVIIGEALAERLRLGLEDYISIISSAGMRVATFKVSGLFKSGMYDYDSSLVFIGIEDAQRLFDLGGVVSGIGVKIEDVYRADEVKDLVRRRLGLSFWTRSWMDINRNLFEALKLEKTAMFIIMALIVVVASFNIASTLIMLVMEKTKDIGILKSMGATMKSIRAIFTLEGLFIGLAGTLLGIIGGVSLCRLLTKYQFIKLPSDIYYIDTLPVKMEWLDLVVIVSASIVISLVATLYPAHQAARLNPVDALRYE